MRPYAIETSGSSLCFTIQKLTLRLPHAHAHGLRVTHSEEDHWLTSISCPMTSGTAPQSLPRPCPKALTCVVRALALFLAMMGCTSRRTSMSCCTFQKLSFSSLRFRPLRWFFCKGAGAHRADGQADAKRFKFHLWGMCKKLQGMQGSHRTSHRL